MLVIHSSREPSIIGVNSYFTYATLTLCATINPPGVEAPIFWVDSLTVLSEIETQKNSS